MLRFIKPSDGTKPKRIPSISAAIIVRRCV
jgi:hypothetical protein